MLITESLNDEQLNKRAGPGLKRAATRCKVEVTATIRASEAQPNEISMSPKCSADGHQLQSISPSGGGGRRDAESAAVAVSAEAGGMHRGYAQ